VSPDGTKQLSMDEHGNLCVYDENKDAKWSTQTMGNAGAYLAFQNDGNLVVYSSADGQLWEADVHGCGPLGVDDEGCYITIQNDCNVVMYHSDGSYAGWASGTECS